MEAAILGFRERLGALRGEELVRASLKLDAAITGVNGLAYVAAAGVLDSALGYSQGVLIGAGAFLLAFAGAVLAIGTRITVSHAAVRGVIAANAAWAVGSVALAIADTLTPTTAGTVWLVLQAGTVAGFAALQTYALRRRVGPLGGCG